jgi:hypothetical protein
LEDGKLDIQEDDARDSFSLESSHDSILEFAEQEEVEVSYLVG